jgi:hypothetical protein
VLSSSWFKLYTLAQHSPLACIIHVVGRQGFEPWKPMATDLQSAPFGHLGTCPKHPARDTKNKYGILIIDFLFHRNDEKRKASRSTHGFPSLIE